MKMIQTEIIKWEWRIPSFKCFKLGRQYLEVIEFITFKYRPDRKSRIRGPFL